MPIIFINRWYCASGWSHKNWVQCNTNVGRYLRTVWHSYFLKITPTNAVHQDSWIDLFGSIRFQLREVTLRVGCHWCHQKICSWGYVSLPDDSSWLTPGQLCIKVADLIFCSIALVWLPDEVEYSTKHFRLLKMLWSLRKSGSVQVLDPRWWSQSTMYRNTSARSGSEILRNNVAFVTSLHLLTSVQRSVFIYTL